jgi:hypothetical protein
MREEYFKLEKTSRKNLQLARMSTFANACGKDLIEFILEAKPKAEKQEAEATEMQKAEAEKQEVKAESKTKAAEKAKAPLLLQSLFVKTTLNTKTTPTYKCLHCDFTTDSLKALSGHQKRHSEKYHYSQTQ